MKSSPASRPCWPRWAASPRSSWPGPSSALSQRDTQLADLVIADDDKIDALELAIEESADDLTIAKRQPMARDLREIMVGDQDLLRSRAHRRSRQEPGQAHPCHFRQPAAPASSPGSPAWARWRSEQLQGRARRLCPQGRGQGARSVARRRGDRCPLQFDLPRAPDLYDGGSPHHRALHPSSVWREEYRAHRRSRDQHRGERLLPRSWQADRRGASEEGHRPARPPFDQP